MSSVRCFSVLDSRPPKSSVPNQLQVDQDKRVSCSITSFKWRIFSEGDQAIQPFFFHSHNIYSCLSFSMNKRVCDVHLDFIYTHTQRVEIEEEKKTFFFCFYKQLIQSSLSNEITNWNYWRITISECIVTLLICRTIFSFHYQINNGYQSILIW